jgi:hypothetical protein
MTLHIEVASTVRSAAFSWDLGLGGTDLAVREGCGASRALRAAPREDAP